MAKRRHTFTDPAADKLLPAPLKLYLERVGAQIVNFKKARIEVTGEGGYRREIAVIRWSAGGSVECNNPDFAPTEAETKAIEEALADPALKFPVVVPIMTLDGAPEIVRNTPEHCLHVCRSPNGKNILFVQRRWYDKSGQRHFQPWTHWDDDVWRPMEPDLLPLWGLEQLKGFTTIIFHEGAGAAAHCRWMVEAKTPEAREALEAHPWGSDLRHAAHLGWLGGALHPERVDWSAVADLKGCTFIFVADNDRVGKEAIGKIARYHLPGHELSAIFFDRRFQKSELGNPDGDGFDLADPFPETLFETIKGQPFYRGPSFEDCRIAATWATKEIPNPSGKGRPVHVIHRAFLDQWYSINKPRQFASVLNPSRLYDENEFNVLVRPFSDVDDTARLLARHVSGQVDSVTYDPGQLPGIVVANGKRLLNIFVGTRILPKAGDPAPFIEFMTYLVPAERDRQELLRWMATLVAKLTVRLGYGVLLISEVQGVGKSTLMEKILLPLVGRNNVAVPNERQLVESSFNSWLAFKRLVLVHEIYAGQSKKAYNTIKPYITERTIRVNEKFQPEYEVDNWAAFLAASNSTRALHMAWEDRRWFVPGITEKKKPHSYWVAFNEWLSGDGLSIILHYLTEFAEEPDGYVLPGTDAPTTMAKMDLIEESMSEGQRLVLDLAQLAAERGQGANPEKIVLTDRAVLEWVARKRGIEKDHPHMEGLATIASCLKKGGLTMVDRKFKSHGVRFRAFVNFDVTEDKEWMVIADLEKPWAPKPAPGSKALLPYEMEPDDVLNNVLPM